LIGQISGFFVFDTAARTFAAIDLTFSPGPGASLASVPLFAFTVDEVGAADPGAASFVTRSLGPDYENTLAISVLVEPDFSTAGGQVNQISIRRCGNADCSFVGGLGVRAGAINFRSEEVSVIPVPAGLPLLGGGLALLGMMWRLGKKARRADT
jgi:hypothetical protein